jgi:hypothetical protein
MSKYDPLHGRLRMAQYQKTTNNRREHKATHV